MPRLCKDAKSDRSLKTELSKSKLDIKDGLGAMKFVDALVNPSSVGIGGGPKIESTPPGEVDDGRSLN
eukprot:CAMPEP_0203660488 /NCGR_PEP_ID=MMETSP0088-20131115/56544_1 /ASSEMBLY_ACC=CAM_ASM_001087 /TAXON_ID=426623 /ORGANISM="Chaetoceros affinis, Strain CCMP159" /LENGTH=67 /DNA_ID=CAMNT_0050522877 /DNA_START=23 /DNA_END=224 /DNA_ORIENTATION=+